jgi:hypothetical protein
LLLGLASGVSFSHLLQSGPKKILLTPQFLAIQQILLRNYGPAIGGVEVAALFSTAAMAIVRWQEPVARILATLASTCVLVMVLIWAVWINRINTTVNSWTSESTPLNLAQIRDRWHYRHAIRLAFSVIGFSAVIAALLV